MNDSRPCAWRGIAIDRQQGRHAGSWRQVGGQVQVECALGYASADADGPDPGQQAARLLAALVDEAAPGCAPS